jgi:hypothetical protein
LLCGVLAGAAAAVKYPGFAGAAVAAAVLLGVRAQRRPLAAVAFGSAFLLLGAPWAIKNALVTGDPFYPLLSAYRAAPPTLAGFAHRYLDMTRSWCGGPATLADALALPWRMLVDPRRYCGDPGYALRIGSVFFLFALGFWKRLAPLLLAMTALTALWFLESRQDRFLVAALCLYTSLMAIGAARLPQRLGHACAAVLAVLCAAAVAADWVPAMLFDASNPISPAYAYLSGRQSADGYLAERLESYDTARWARTHLAADARIIALDDVRDYYFAGRATWGNPFYQPVWQIDWRAPPSARYRRLAAAGYAYLTVNANGAYVRRTPTGVDWQVLARDIRLGVLKVLFSAHGVTLLRIDSSRQSKRSKRAP